MAQSFGALEISGNPKPVSSYYSQAEPAFVGGFSTGYSASSDSYSQYPTTLNGRPPISTHAASSPGPGPLPRPPAMPNPYAYQPSQTSLTLQHALRPDGGPGLLMPQTPPSRPHSASVYYSPHFDPVPFAQTSGPPAPSPSASKPRPTSAPPKPQRPPVLSKRTSSGDSTSQQTQCAGVTKAGKRCTRQVKHGPALSQAMSEDDDEDSTMQQIERFCFQHTKELLGPSGYYARKNGEWVDFVGKEPVGFCMKILSICMTARTRLDP